jgi:hypothetical protein
MALLAVAEPELGVADPEVAVADAEVAVGDAEVAMCDPECMEGLTAGADVWGAAALLALLPLGPELHAARVTAAPEISTAATVLTDAKGLTGLTGLTCDFFTMRTWSPADAS